MAVEAKRSRTVTKGWLTQAANELLEKVKMAAGDVANLAEIERSIVNFNERLKKFDSATIKHQLRPLEVLL
jgi:hypothetical protein